MKINCEYFPRWNFPLGLSPDGISPNSFTIYNVEKFNFQKRPKSNVFHITSTHKDGHVSTYILKNITKLETED